MINFFRKIRKKMADDNRPLKYMRYAIGEIALVVIGILIALQINNWNEDKKEKLLENKIILEIRENLINDIRLSKLEIEIQKNHISYLKNLIIHLELKLPNNDTLNFDRVIYFEHLYVNKSGYETLKNIGLEKLRSKYLKNELTTYYDISANRRTEITTKMNDSQVNAFMNYSYEMNKNYIGDPKNLPYFIATNGRFYINHLYSRISWKQNFIKDILEQHITQSESIIEIIKQEIID